MRDRLTRREPQGTSPMVEPIHERQAWETDTEHAWLMQHLAAGPERTYKATAATLGVHVSTVSHLASKCRWQIRAEAWDREISDAVSRSLFARQILARAEQADLGRAMRQKAAEAVEMLGDELKPQDIASLATAGTKIERDALQLVNKTEAEVTVNVQATELDDDARAALRAELAARLAQLGGTDPEPDASDQDE